MHLSASVLTLCSQTLKGGEVQDLGVTCPARVTMARGQEGESKYSLGHTESHCHYSPESLVRLWIPQVQRPSLCLSPMEPSQCCLGVFEYMRPLAWFMKVSALNPWRAQLFSSFCLLKLFPLSTYS